MADLDNVYKINERIKKLQEKIEKINEKNSRKGKAIDNAVAREIEDLNAQINELMLERTRELKKVRWREKRQPKERPDKKPIVEPDPSPVPLVTERIPTPVPQFLQCSPSSSALKATEIYIGTNSTTVTMVPKWFTPDDPDDALNNIVYPDDTTVERNQFLTIARFRTSLGQSTDFTLHPIDINPQSTEMVVLSLQVFAQQFDGQLSFTNRDLTFEDSAENAACGVPNIGSLHLLANDSIPTAKFTFRLNIDYDRHLAHSHEAMENFLTNFSVAIAEVLECKDDYVRVFSIHKSTNEQGVVEVNFGLTTPDRKETELLVIKLLELAKTGFGGNEILQLVQLREYECKWRSVFSYLELKATDFDRRFNFDYTRPNLPTQHRRGNKPYYLPLGWYRHGLNVSEKYFDDIAWLGNQNLDGEWPVAYHGTHSGAVRNIMINGLAPDAAKRDRMVEEAIEQKGLAVDRPGLYLATHCNGGSDGYATTFTVENGDKTETFQVVFQCRVRPRSYTTHSECVKTGYGWRVVDPTAIRPYGLLIRKKDI